MAEISRQDEEVLRLLTKEGLIVRSQELRLRAGLKRGMSLGEAVSKTPLVEAVKLASIQSLATQNLKHSMPHEPVHPGKETPSPGDGMEGALTEDYSELKGFKIQNFGPVDPLAETARDLDSDLDDGVPTYELELEDAGIPEEDLDLPDADGPRSPLEKMPPLDDMDDLDLTPMPADIEDEIDTIRVLPAKRPNAPTEAEFENQVGSALEEAFEKKEAHGSRSSAEIPKPGIEHMDALAERDSYQPVVPVQMFDLADSEGINLIEEVNGVLMRAVDDEGRGFTLDPQLAGDQLVSFGKEGKPVRRETIGEGMADKVTNRLKVMARLEPWRSQTAQKGKFEFKAGAVKGTAYVCSEPIANGGELLKVHLERT